MPPWPGIHYWRPRLMSGTPTAGNALELTGSGAAVDWRGIASRRRRHHPRAFLGVVFVALINNTMTMLAVSVYWQMIVIGVVLITAVAARHAHRKQRV